MKKFTFLLSALLLVGGLAWANVSGWSPLTALTNAVEAVAEEAEDYYPIAYSKDEAANGSGRTLQALTIVSPAFSEQTVDNPATNKFYSEVLEWGEGFQLAPGESVTMKVTRAGEWMHHFIYLDKGQDGQFDVSPAETVEDLQSAREDIWVFTAAGVDANGLDKNALGNGYFNSVGANADPHMGTMPAEVKVPELPNGFYRARLKQDWAYLNPAGGRTSETNDTHQVSGQFIDFRVHIHGYEANVAVVSEGGQVTTEDGEALAATTTFGRPMTFKVAADATHELVSVKVRYGYNFDGEAVQYGMEQWREAELEAVEGVYTLTKEMTSADVQITATYEEVPVDYVPVARVSQLEAGKVYMIQNATSQPWNGNDRWGMLYNGDNGIKINQVKPSEFTTQDVAYLWTVEVVDAAAGVYNVKSVATSLYANEKGNITDLSGVNLDVKEFSASAVKGNASYMSEADNSVFVAAADVTPADKLWTLSKGNTCWNGNSANGDVPPTFATWSDGHGFAFYEVTNQEAALAALAEAEAAHALQRSEEYKALAETVNAKFGEWVTKAQAESGVTDAAMYSTNAQEGSEGPIADIIDGNVETYFHSAYQGTVNEPHYLQINRGENVGDFYFYSYKRTQNTNNRPTKMTISGSNDGVEFTEIKVLENISLANPYYISEIIAGGDYQHIRFTMNETNNNAKLGDHVFFTYGEFYLINAKEGFGKQLHEALAAFNGIQSVADIAPAAALVKALDAPAIATKVVSVDPAGPEVGTLPNTIRVEFDAAPGMVLMAMAQGADMAQLAEGAGITTEGNVMTLTIPESVTAGSPMMMVGLYVAADETGENVLEFSNHEDYEGSSGIVLVYEATGEPTPPATGGATFALAASDPADGTLLKEMPTTVKLTMVNPADANDYIGGIDATKEIVFEDDWGIAGNCALTFEEGTCNATVTISETYPFDGTYTLTIPEGTIYNKAYSGGAAPIADAAGVIYNPEIKLTFKVELPTHTDEELALMEKAWGYILNRGQVGYPTMESDAFNNLVNAANDLQANPNNAEKKATLEAAFVEFYACAEINLPEAGKKYSFTYVTNAGKLAYLNYTGSDIALVPYAESDVLPETAGFLCEENEDGTFSFKTDDGKYLVYHSNYNGVTWLQGNGNTKGYEDTKTDMANITLAKMLVGGEVKGTNEELVGLVTWYGKRGYDTGKNQDSYGYTVVKTDFSNYDGAGAPFYNANYTSALRLAEYQVPPTTVTITPEPGNVEALPATITMEFSRNIKAVEYAVMRTDLSQREFYELAADSYVIEGNKLTVNLPAEALEGQYDVNVVLRVLDEKDMYVTYGWDYEDAISVTYSTPRPANCFEAIAIDPAEGEVTSLKQFTITFNDATSAWGTMVGGFDPSKVVVLKNAAGEEVAQGAVDYHAEIWEAAVVTLNAEITAEGTYTLVVPEGTVYNGYYDGGADDFGVSWGAIYNPELTFTYTIGEGGGTVDPAEPLGAALTSPYEAQPNKAYVLYNPSHQAYAVYKEEYSTSDVWLAGAKDGHQPVNYPAYAEPVDLTNPGSSWMLLQKGEGTKVQFYLYNIGAQGFMVTPAVTGNDKCGFVSMENEFIEVEVLAGATDQYGNTGFAFRSKGATQEAYGADLEWMCAAPQLETPVSRWTSDDPGSIWQMKENPNVDADQDILDALVAIATAKLNGEDASIYTISGLKLNIVDPKKLPTGVYIINGKKVIKK